MPARNLRNIRPPTLSIRLKFPLFMCSLAVLVLVIVGTAAFLQVRNVATRTATSRLDKAAEQMASLFRQSVVVLQGQTGKMAGEQVAAYATTRDARTRSAAAAALKYTGAQPEQVVATELRDASGHSILSLNAHLGDSLQLQVDTMTTTARSDTFALGRMRLVAGNILYPASALVPEGNGMRLVVWRRLMGSPTLREQITGLIGSDATVLFGNADGSVVTDLSGATVADSGAAAPQIMEAVQPIAGSPWAVRVQFPRAEVMAPVSEFLRWLVLIGLACIAIAFLAAWILSRRIIAPLEDMTDVAQAFAGGDYTQRVRVTTRDEFRQVADAFNIMAAEIEGSQKLLEQRVTERTRELNDALDQLREAQDALVRREKLALMGQLASGVGHELRNPLGVMNNAVYFLRAVLTDAPPKVVEYLDILREQVTLSERIVSDLLDFARIKDPRRETVDVRALVAAQMDRARPPAGVNVDIRIPEDLPRVKVDPLQVGQVVLNLVVNAVQAMNGQGTMTIEAGVEQGDRVALRVSDTGSGVEPQNLEKIFEALFTTKARGIGLGLAVSRGLARANGGDITVRSKPGEGAVFTLDMPVLIETVHA